MTTPEGLELALRVGGLDQRAGALILDTLILFAAILIFGVLAAFGPMSGLMAQTVVGMFAFLATTFYFIYFELAWQGRTPGKKIIGLRVVKRNGGELGAESIVARNLTRQVELYLPLALSLVAMSGEDPETSLIFLGWVTILVAVPFLSKRRLRAGDYIAGTMVVSMPKRALPPDLTKVSATKPAYVFTDEQLGIYGNLELQALEDVLRQAETAAPASRRNSIMAMEIVADKICRKIGYASPPPRGDEYQFLKAFYLAEREVLEKGLILGRRKESKLDPVESIGGHSEKRP